VHAELARGVVQARPAVQQEQRGPLNHLHVDWHEPQPVHVHVHADPDPTSDVDAHVVSYLPSHLMPSRFVPSRFGGSQPIRHTTISAFDTVLA
jgi:hypothetical protein